MLVGIEVINNEEDVVVTGMYVSVKYIKKKKKRGLIMRGVEGKFGGKFLKEGGKLSFTIE